MYDYKLLITMLKFYNYVSLKKRSEENENQILKVFTNNNEIKYCTKSTFF